MVFGKSIAKAVVAAIIIFAIIIGMVVLVIILNNGVRKIPVQYAKKVQGRKMVGGQTTNILQLLSQSIFRKRTAQTEL